VPARPGGHENMKRLFERAKAVDPRFVFRTRLNKHSVLSGYVHQLERPKSQQKSSAGVMACRVLVFSSVTSPRFCCKSKTLLLPRGFRFRYQLLYQWFPLEIGIRLQ